MLRGGYWLKKPTGTQAIAYMGATAPEAVKAWSELIEHFPGLGLLAITSPDLLHREWSAALASSRSGENGVSHVETLLRPLGRDGRIVTLVDGSPSALSWIGAVLGQRVHALGVDRFGQTGDLVDLHRSYELDSRAIGAAAISLFS